MKTLRISLTGLSSETLIPIIIAEIAVISAILLYLRGLLRTKRDGRSIGVVPFGAGRGRLHEIKWHFFGGEWEFMCIFAARISEKTHENEERNR